MGFHTKLKAAWEASQSMLCVGLDPDPDRLPISFDRDTASTYEFCKAIVDATADTVCAFKPQFAYFAAQRAEPELEKLCGYIRDTYPRVLLILDAKRGDIGPTAQQYAREAFDRYGADVVTVNPYLGTDSIEPYLAYEGRGVFVLCRTSNPGGGDFQSLDVKGEPLFANVARRVGNGVERARRLRARGRRDVPRRARHGSSDRRRHARARTGSRRPRWRHRGNRRGGCDRPMASG